MKTLLATLLLTASVAAQEPAKPPAARHEISRKMDVFDNIAHVFSTYESRHAKGDATPFARGINSFQLMKDGDRWWIVTIYWEGERPGHPIPPQYLRPTK